MLKPLSSYFNLGTAEKKAATFGQDRAERLTQRMDKAVADRRTLARAEAAAADPIKSAYSQKSLLAERKIDRITAELSEAKK